MLVMYTIDRPCVDYLRSGAQEILDKAVPGETPVVEMSPRVILALIDKIEQMNTALSVLVLDTFLAEFLQRLDPMALRLVKAAMIPNPKEKEVSRE